MSELPAGFLQACQEQCPEQIVTEFLIPQIEIVTKPCNSIASLRQELLQLRRQLFSIASEFGLGILAASTHPFSTWRQLPPNPTGRYQRLDEILKISAWRLCVGGMHIHAGIHDENERVQILNELTWYLPHLLALTTSSPFWAGMDTGFHSYRKSVIDALPRSGLPECFPDYQTYCDYVDSLHAFECVEDAAEIWWDARLSAKFPTVEMRIADTCPRAHDAINIAALYYCLVYWLRHEAPRKNFDVLQQQRLWQKENCWNAQRYSIEEAKFINCETQQVAPCKTVIMDLLNQLEPVAGRLSCLENLQGIETILEQGTCADRQRKLFMQLQQNKVPEKDIMLQITDHLLAESKMNVV